MAKSVGVKGRILSWNAGAETIRNKRQRHPTAQGFDGHIDDPNGGWKGRGLWTASGDRTPWLREGGKGSLPLAVQFQIRKHPLER